MTQADLISLLQVGAGVGLSALVSYYTPAAEWYYGLPKNLRGLVMLGLNAVAALFIFGLSCSQLFNWVACTQESAMDLARAFLVIAGTSLGAYMTLPTGKTKLRLDAKLEEDEKNT